MASVHSGCQGWRFSCLHNKLESCPIVRYCCIKQLSGRVDYTENLEGDREVKIV